MPRPSAAQYHTVIKRRGPGCAGRFRNALSDHGTGLGACDRRCGLWPTVTARRGCESSRRLGRLPRLRLSAYALDLGEAIERFQRTSPMPTVVQHAMWVPDRGVATMIGQSVLASIALHRRAGGRHDLSAEAVSGEVGLTTFRLYPGAVTVPHDQLIGRWAKERA